jgi:transcriptional regulator with XRE-family HTH domain
MMTGTEEAYMEAATNVDLRKTRDERDLTREQLADMVHVSPSTIENWERGISNPGPDDVDNITRA